MARWLVKLSGDLFDLEEFPRLFVSSDVHAIDEGGEVFLVGEAFERLSRAEEVLTAADAALVRMFAVGSLLVRGLRCPTVDRHVIRENDDGGRGVTVFVSGVEARMKAGVVRAVGDDRGTESAGPTQAERMLSMATGRPGLENALDLWGNGTLTWPRLYRLLEELEKTSSARPSTKPRFARPPNANDSQGPPTFPRSGGWTRGTPLVAGSLLLIR